MDEDCSAYVPTYDTATELNIDAHFCPLCEIPESYTADGTRPIAQLHKVVTDIQAENRLSPSAFILFIAKYYEEKTRPMLLGVLHWQKQNAINLDNPAWPVSDVYTHFSIHVADPWLSRNEALRQTNAMLKRTANTCLTRDGPPNPNTVRTFVELTKLRSLLDGK